MARVSQSKDTGKVAEAVVTTIPCRLIIGGAAASRFRGRLIGIASAMARDS